LYEQEGRVIYLRYSTIASQQQNQLGMWITLRLRWQYPPSAYSRNRDCRRTNSYT